jgi:preprotein translocase SecE subunit
MAVAVKNPPEVSAGALDRLPVASLVGVVYVVGALGVVFGLLPWLWWNVLGFSPTSFAAASVLGVVMLAAAVGLAAFGVRVLGAKAPPGTRAGVFAGLAGLLFILLLARWVSMWVEYWVYDAGAFSPTAGVVVVAAFGLGLLAVGLRYFFQRSTERFVVKLEDQGWFHARAYKPLQGQRVRRGTTLGMLLLAGAGIYTMNTHQVLRRGSENWELNVPFTGRVVVTNPGDAASELAARFAGGPNGDQPAVLDRYEYRQLAQKFDPATHVKILLPGDSTYSEGQIVSKSEFLEQRAKVEKEGGVPPQELPVTPPAGVVEYRRLVLLPAVQFTVPLLVLAGSIWLAWRVVNLPVFADFLIATEAEINKVSWTTRRRLVQDTVVVLVTVVLMAGFLFGTDIVWKVLLGSKVVNVLQTDQQHQETTDRDRPLW